MNSRRTFFKQLVSEVARGVHEIRNPPPTRAPATVTPLRSRRASPAPRPPPSLPAAEPTTHGATLDELLALADAVGLGARHAEVARLARASVRLSPGPADAPVRCGGSRLGGMPDLPPHATWPHWREQPLTFRLQLDLAEVAPLLAGGADGVALPETGTLACFSAAEPPDGGHPEHAGAWATLVSPPSAPDAEAAYGRPAVLTRELVLPRRWAAPVTALDLDDDERDAWTELRVRLAAAQGVVPADEDRDREAPHRLLGYPDERTGLMPRACALLAAGLDPADAPPLEDPRSIAAIEDADAWRLVLQLALDDELDWRWGDRRQRLYVWVHERDLAVGDLSRLRAFAR